MDFDFQDDGEEYDFEYEEDDDNDEVAEDGGTGLDQPVSTTSLENQYYAAKALKSQSTVAAIEAFQALLSHQQHKTEWGFKALKQIVKLTSASGDLQMCAQAYDDFLTYTKDTVTRNYAEKSINALLDAISQKEESSAEFLESMYAKTLDVLLEHKNDRLVVKTQLKLARILFDRKTDAKLAGLLDTLHASCYEEGDSAKQNASFLEVLALEIQFYTEKRDFKRLRTLYQQTHSVKSAIPHPKILGIIRECGGKMHLGEKQWSKAQVAFFEALKNYDEAGDARRLHCMRYLLLTHMLMNSSIDPFEAQETKPLQSDPGIIVMTLLSAAYAQKDIFTFQKIYHEHRTNLVQEPFINEYLVMVMNNLRCEALEELIRPYTCINLNDIAQNLQITLADAETALINQIMGHDLDAQIEQSTGNVFLEREHQHQDRLERLHAMTEWAQGVEETCFNMYI